MTTRRIRSLLLAAFLIACQAATTQTYKFRNYSLQQGLVDPFIYTIDQDSSGYLWIGTGEGLMRYGGNSFKEYASPQIASRNLITCSYNTGEHIFYGFDDGSLLRLTNGDIYTIEHEKPPESKVTSIAPLSGSRFVATTQDKGLLIFTEDRVVSHYHQGLVNSILFDVVSVSGDKLLLATDMGVLFVEMTESNGVPVVNEISRVGEEQVVDIEPWDTDFFFAGSPENGLNLISLKNGHLVIEELEIEGIDEAIRTRSLYWNETSGLWISTFGKGLIKVVFDEKRNIDESYVFNENTGLGTEYIQMTFQDREGNIWVGTYGAGLSYLIDEYFSFYYENGENVNNNVTSIWIEDSVKWFGVGKEVRKIRPGKKPPYVIYDERYGLPEDRASCMIRSDDGRFWIGYESSGLYLLNERAPTAKRMSLDNNVLSDNVNDMAEVGPDLFIATFNGIFKYNTRSGEITHITTENGLRHNTVYCLVTDDKGGVWIGSKGNTLSKLSNGELEEHRLTEGEQLISMISMTRTKDGVFWIATKNNGVVKFESETDSVAIFSEQSGLLSNHCYSIEEDGRGRIWIGHRAGLSRIDPETGEVRVYDSRYGLISENNRNAIFGDKDGDVWFGTFNGLIRYDPDKDRGSNVPPGIDISELLINDKPVEQSKGTLDLPYDEYELTFYFRAITFRHPENVEYYYKLEGHDRDWINAANATFATYNRLYDGEYTFKVRACNGQGQCTEKAYPVSIVIDKPYWNKWWFYLLAGLGLVIIVGIVAFFRERNLRRVKQYLEDQLNLRTKEVVRQKEIIEQKNKDITDSINYAKRIQHSMLPDEKEFKKVFPESFVINRPRDIVSGDFYWYYELDDKVLLVCADCTGHGVPGALMSMIGSVALRGISSQDGVSSPSDLLYELDSEVNSVLKQDIDADSFMSSRDGMDLTVCEINKMKRSVRMAGAMRNSIIIIDGEVELFRGDRWSIGGSTNASKVFSTQEYELNKGDTILLFSDGYVDQFGGVDGKKMKMKGLLDLLEQNEWTSMDKMEKRLNDHLDEWQGDYPQMDDIIVVGIRI